MKKYPLPSGKKVSWHTYRIETGKCEMCGEEMREHPFCCRCGIISGIGHDEATFEKNGKKYCGFCFYVLLKREREKHETP